MIWLVAFLLAAQSDVRAAETAESWQRRGLILHLQNKFEEAVPAFRQATRLDASLWTSHLFLGICLYRTNQFRAALPVLERAGRLAPQSHQGRDDVDFWLGATRIVLKQPLAGLQSLESLLARNPKHLDALDLAARTYADLASALWNDIAERHFETAAGYEVHGHALEAEGNVNGALDAYRRSKASNPKRRGPGLAIGRLLLNFGKREEAISALNEELELSPGDRELRELLSAAHKLTVSPPRPYVVR